MEEAKKALFRRYGARLAFAPGFMNHVFTPIGRLCLATLLTTFALPACSSSPGGGAAANVDPADTQFCDAVVAETHRCTSGVTACGNAQLAQFTENCAQTASVFSTAWKNAVTTCGASVPCDSPSEEFLTTCQEAAALGALSAAQSKLASDYCTVCAGTAGLSMATCEGAFWGLEPDAGIFLAGIGSGALAYSDAIVALVDTSCIPELDAGSRIGCINPFADCVGATTATAATTALPAPAACVSGDAGM